MPNYAGLSTALKRFTDNVQAAIESGKEIAVTEVNALMDGLKEQFDLEAIAQGSGTPAASSAIIERHIAMDSNVIDAQAANHFSKTITGATTLSVANVAPVGKVTTFILHLTNGGTNVTWWNNIRWTGGTKPTLTAAGRDVLAFSTKDAGATWDGYVIGQDMKAAA